LTNHGTRKNAVLDAEDLLEDIQVLSKREVMPKINYFSLFVGAPKKTCNNSPLS